MLKYLVYSREEDFDLILKEGVDFEGEIKTPTALVEKAQVTGSLVSQGLVNIVHKARFEGELRARVLCLDANFQGNLQVESLHLLSSSQTQGELRCDNICMEEGSRFTGNLVMNTSSVQDSDSSSSAPKDV